MCRLSYFPVPKILLPVSPSRWLRLQGTLKEHHETLQLALEAAAFVQQAEVLLGAIHAKVDSRAVSKRRWWVLSKNCIATCLGA